MEKLKVDEKIEKAIEEFDRLVDDPEHHDEYLARKYALLDEISFLSDARDRGLAEGREKGLEEGRAEGLAEGKKEVRKKQIEIAKNLLKENADIDLIAKVTGLTKEEIEKLK